MSWLIGKDWCSDGFGAGGEGDAENEMAGWHHQIDGHEFELTLRVGDRQGGLERSQRVGHDWATELNWIPFWFPTSCHSKPIVLSFLSSMHCLSFLLLCGDMGMTDETLLGCVVAEDPYSDLWDSKCSSSCPHYSLAGESLASLSLDINRMPSPWVLWSI